MLLEILKDGLHRLRLTFEESLMGIVKVFGFIIPYITLLIGILFSTKWLALIIGLTLPIVVNIINWLMTEYANRIGKGTDIPVPAKRFTEINDDEVQVRNDRLQDLILYMADLEDWFERKRLL